MAAELGFEPRHTESESAVLPLHNSASHFYYYNQKIKYVKYISEFFINQLFFSANIFPDKIQSVTCADQSGDKTL